MKEAGDFRIKAAHLETNLFAPGASQQNCLRGKLMARVTIEDCLQKVPNRYELIILAAKRAKQLFAGEKPLLETNNLEIVTALREIAAGKVRKADMH
jgi:DNA-directed RNA polymerase subunit omega